MLLCSGGDFYGTADEYNEPKSRFVARMMGRLEYDAVCVGEMDLNYGLAQLQEEAAADGLNLVCANLVSKEPPTADSGSPQARYGTAFPPYRVVERDGVRFGFVGLLSPGTKVRQSMSTPDAPREVTGVNYIIKDPTDVAEEVIPEARQACDVLILLAHMDRTELDALLADFPEVDIAVQGHDPKSSAFGTPERSGNALVLKATSQGQYIGDLSFSLDANKHIASFDNRVHFLDDAYPDDEATVKLVDEFEAENRKLQKVLYAKSQLRGSRGTPGANRYVGVGTCQSCHVDAFNVYMHTQHAHAYETLSAQFVHRDTNCVGCHVTGWKDVGGFTGTQFRGDPVDLIDVQCEACHGPGSEHRRDGSYRQAARESCVKCHTKNDDPEFDFAKDWPKIAH